MQKIGSSTTTADENGEFTDGDPQREISCTWVMAAWLNTLQRELVHLCEEAGIPLDPADDTQVYKAISALLNAGVKGMVKSVNTHKPDANGEVTLPDASTTVKGIVQLNSATNSTSETLAATPKAVKAVQDAVSALDKLTVKTVNTHKPDTAGNVKLGTAADADVQTSVADLTTGRVLTVGKSYGLGPSGVDRASLSVLRSTVGYTGFTWSQNTDSEAPPFFGASQSFGIQNHIWHQSSDNYALQTVWRDGKIGFRTVEANTVGPWCEYFHTKNPPTATQTGALPLTGGAMTGEIKSTSGNILRGIQGGYGAILRMDANGLYFLQTNKNDPSGNYNANRSLMIANDTGAVTIGTPFTVNNASEFITKAGVNNWTDSSGNNNQTNGLRLKGNGNLTADIALHELVNNYLALAFHVYGTGGDDGWFDMRAPGHFIVGGGDPQLHVGNAQMVGDGNIWGTRWNPNGQWLWDAITDQIRGIGQLSVSGNQWWAKINLNGSTLIVQGGYAEVRDAEVTDRIPLNIAVPNRLLHVAITNRNFAQGYATYNPQVTVLNDDNTGFNFVHGQKERMIYWMAVGY